MQKNRTWLTRLADRMILCPSTDLVDSGELIQELIPNSGGHLEAWTCSVENPNATRKILLIKFPGNAGRAERSTSHPAHLWNEIASEIWTINPFGYGGSSGTASVQRIPEMVDAVFNALRPRFANHKIVVYGNSLGTVAALTLAARYPVDGLYLRNPVPIHELISSRIRYALPSLGLSRLIANQIPKTLNAVDNAKEITLPCLFVTSENDRLIPAHFQAKIIKAFGGPKHIFVIPDADHHDPIPEAMGQEYQFAIDWLDDQIFLESNGS